MNLETVIALVGAIVLPAGAMIWRLSAQLTRLRTEQTQTKDPEQWETLAKDIRALKAIAEDTQETLERLRKRQLEDLESAIADMGKSVTELTKIISSLALKVVR